MAPTPENPESWQVRQRPREISVAHRQRSILEVHGGFVPEGVGSMPGV